MSDLAADVVDANTPVQGDDPAQFVREQADALRRAFTELGVRQSYLLSVEVSITFTAGSATTIEHGLGSTPNRWMVTDIDDLAILYRTGTWTSTRATLTASGGTSGTAKVRFWSEL